MDIRTWLNNDVVYKMLLKIRREWSPSEYIFLENGIIVSRWKRS